MSERFLRPFKLKVGEEAVWIEDRLGRGFAYVYFREQPIVGTDRSGRASKGLAVRMVKWILVQMEGGNAKPG